MATDPCPICSKKFRNLDLLSNHIERRHGDEASANSYVGPHGGAYEDSEGEIRTSRLEREKALWSPHTELEREMSGARDSSSIRNSMRQERARERSPGLWPVVIDTSVRAGRVTLSAAAQKSMNTPSERTDGQNSSTNIHLKRKQLPRGAGNLRTNVRPYHVDHFSETSNNDSLPAVHKVVHNASFRRHESQQDDAVRQVRQVRQVQLSSATDDVVSESSHNRDSAIPTFSACPLEECGEQVLSTDIDDHIERHQAEQLILEGDDPSLSCIRQLSPTAIANEQSIPIITTHFFPDHCATDYNRDNTEQLPSYQPPSSSSLASGHSFYAPEKSDRPSSNLNSLMSYSSKQHNTATQPPLPDRPRSAVSLMGPGRTGHNNDIARQTLFPPSPDRHDEHDQHRRLVKPVSNSLRLPANDDLNISRRSRPKSAMAVLSHSTGGGPLRDMSARKPISDSGPSQPPVKQTKSLSQRQKRSSQIESAISDVKGRLSSFSLTETVDGLERRLRTSRQRHESEQLGKQALGPYAYESEMPTWLYKQLQRGPRVYLHKSRGRDGRMYVEEIIENETPGIVAMLARLSELDTSVDRAYLCHPATIHVSKIRGEGGFCGYRNIQMQISYLQGAEARGHDAFPGTRIPGVLHLQDMVERAWDMGFYASSRREIGRLRGTRKWIGSVEAHALFESVGASCDSRTFIDDPVEGRMAYENLFVFVESYFRGNVIGPPNERIDKVARTLLPPLYLQYPGHSITVVGYEVHKTGQRNLLVLDPMYITSRAMDQLLDAGTRRIRRSRNEILQVYRRHEVDFKKYASIEVLCFSSSAPASRAWDVLHQERITNNLKREVLWTATGCSIGKKVDVCTSSPKTKSSSAINSQHLRRQCCAQLFVRDQAWKNRAEERSHQWQLDVLSLQRRTNKAEMSDVTVAKILQNMQALLLQHTSAAVTTRHVRC